MEEKLVEDNYIFRIINTKLPMYYEFPRSPSMLTYNVAKVYQETRTIGGFVFEHWGNRPVTLKIDGLVLKNDKYATQYGFTDVLYNKDLLKLKLLFNMDKRKMSSSLSQLTDQLSSSATASSVSDYLNSLSDTIIQYKTDIMTGFFINFQYSEDASNPYFNKYSMEFLVTSSLEDLVVNSLLSLPAGQAILGIGASII